MNKNNSLSPIFVIGSSRSGTTMFRLMLNKHSQLYIPNESHFLTPIMDELPTDRPLSQQQLDRTIDIMIPFLEKRDWDINKSGLLKIAKDLQNPTLSAFIDAIYKKLSNNLRWGDKTPMYLTEVGRLHNLFPHAQFIHVIRDGRDVCISCQKTGWHGGTASNIANYWNKEVYHGCMAGRALNRDQYIEISYEDLVLDTENTLKIVCDFLGTNFESSMLNFYEDAGKHIAKNAPVQHHTKIKRKPKKDDIQRWQKELNKLHLVIFESIAGDTMKLIGQQPYYSKWIRKPIGFVVKSLTSFVEFTLPFRNKIDLHFPKFRKKF